MPNNNPNKAIGIGFPLTRGNSGYFKQTYTTAEQAKSNLRNLLLTRKGERVMQPEFGSRIYDMLFEQNDEFFDKKIKTYINDAVEVWLPYIIINRIDVVLDETEHQYNIHIKYSLRNDPKKFDSITLNFQGIG